MKIQNVIKVSVLALIPAVGLSLFPTPETRAAGSGAASPRSLYNTNCAICHGADGRSDTPRGRETDATDITSGLSSAKITRIVKSGRGDMPAFSKRLTVAQIKQIVTYVRSL